MANSMLSHSTSLAGLGLVLTLAALPAAANAQQMQPLPPVPGTPQAGGPPTAPKGKSSTSPTAAPKAAPKAEGGGQASAGSESGLRQRVDQLEEQIVDMQVVIGTLESLAKSGGGGGASVAAPAARPSPQPSVGAYSSSDAARMDGLETQIRALTAQIEQLAEQVRVMDGRRASAPGPGGPAVLSQGVQQPTAGKFGTTVVAPGGSGNDQMADNAPPSPFGRPAQPGSPPAAGASDGAAPKQLYETAYNHLLQQDYGAAEAGFDDFIKRYPINALASNAQYWLGETYFVRGQFKQAASAFLKGYQIYSRSAKAPDSLLKLAMSLERLGQRDAACSSYSELASKYPNAPNHIRNRAQTERQRIGCA